MGMTLPDLPPRKRTGWRMAYEYLKTHGPSTIDQIVGTNDEQETSNMANILRIHSERFVQCGVTAPNNARGKKIWTMKEGA